MRILENIILPKIMLNLIKNLSQFCLPLILTLVNLFYNS